MSFCPLLLGSSFQKLSGTTLAMPTGQLSQFVRNRALCFWTRLTAACIRVWWDNLYFDKERISATCEKAYRRALRASTLLLL